MKRFLLSVLVCMACSYALAYDFKIKNENGQTFYFNFVGGKSSGRVETTCSKKKKPYNDVKKDYIGDIEIPSEVTYKKVTYKVVAVGNHTFSNCNVTSVIIPEGVNRIGWWAFEFSKLNSVILPESIKEIATGAFLDTPLTSIKLPEGLQRIGSGAFSYTKITQIKLPKHVVTDGRAFWGCENLKVIDFGNINTIKRSDFEGCTSLKEVEFPAEVKFIEENAFKGCTNLAHVTFAGQPSNVSPTAFEGTLYEKNLIAQREREKQERLERQREEARQAEQAARLEQNRKRFENQLNDANVNGIIYRTNRENPNTVWVYHINWDEALKTNSLSNFVIPSHITVYDKQYPVTAIGGNCFEESNISGVTIPNTVQFLGPYAFRRCQRLTSINIPSSVKDIYDMCFSGCRNLTSINIPSSVVLHKDVFEGTPEYEKKRKETRDAEIQQLVNQYSKKYGRNILMQIVNAYKNASNWEDAHMALPIGAPLEFLQAYTRRFVYRKNNADMIMWDDQFTQAPNDVNESGYGRIVTYYENRFMSPYTYVFRNGKLSQKYKRYY